MSDHDEAAPKKAITPTIPGRLRLNAEGLRQVADGLESESMSNAVASAHLNAVIVNLREVRQLLKVPA